MKITICRDENGLYSKHPFFFLERFSEDRLIRRMLKSQHIPIIKKGEELTVDLSFRNPRNWVKERRGR